MARLALGEHRAADRHAYRRRHVGRRRLVGRRGAARRAGPRRHRSVDAALRSAAGRPALRQLLHARRPARRAARGRGARHSRTTSSTSSGVPARRSSSNFVGEYAAGRTPIPCAHCNSDLKFATLLDRARGLRRRSASRPATTRASSATTDGRCLLQRGADRRQGSVVLPVLADAGAARARASSRSATLTKAEVRAHARALGLAGRREARQPGDLLRARRRLRGVRRAPGAGGRARRRDRRRGRPRARPPRRRAPLHGRPAQGARPLVTGRRCTSWSIDAAGPPRRRRPARGARAHDADGVGRELDRRATPPTSPHRASAAQIRHRHRAAPGRASRRSPTATARV